LESLSSLVDKSLVMVEEHEGEARYRLLETVRQYAAEKLDESGEAEAVRERHARHYLALAEEAEPELTGTQQEAWLGRLETEHDNLRAALSWALAHGEAELGLRLGSALGEFWHMRGYLGEGRRWLEAALAKVDANFPLTFSEVQFPHRPNQASRRAATKRSPSQRS
jgi:predicted ATPase